MTRPAVPGVLITRLTLFGGLLPGFALGALVFIALPSHRRVDPQPLHILLAALGGMLAGAALRGVLIWGAACPGPARAAWRWRAR